MQVCFVRVLVCVGVACRSGRYSRESAPGMYSLPPACRLLCLDLGKFWRNFFSFARATFNLHLINEAGEANTAAVAIHSIHLERLHIAILPHTL